MKGLHLHCRLRQFHVNAPQQSPGDKAITPEKQRLGELLTVSSTNCMAPHPISGIWIKYLKCMSLASISLQRKQVFSFSVILEGSAMMHWKKKERERGTNTRNINVCFKHARQALGLLTHRRVS